MHTMAVPKSVHEEAIRRGLDGVKSRRNKGQKHFRKVGYMGDDLKEVPRWACSNEAIELVIRYQKKKESAYLQIFGQFKPSHVQE